MDELVIRQPHDYRDWATMLPHEMPRLPVHEGALTDRVIHTFMVHNARIGPLITDDVESVDLAVSKVRFANENAPIGGRRCLVVNGPSHMGKTHAVLTHLLTELRDHSCTHKDSGPHPPRWLYTEADGAGHGRSLAANLCAFANIPLSKRDTTADLIRRLRHMVRPMGTVGVVIDDFGSLQPRGASVNELANTMKTLITSTPVTFILIGVDLGLSPVLGGTGGSIPGQQIHRRADWLDLTPWPAPVAGTTGPWERLLAGLSRSLALPRGAQQCQLNRRSVLTLVHQGSGGRPGTAIEWVKNAAHHATNHDVPLDAAALRATHPGRVSASGNP